MVLFAQKVVKGLLSNYCCQIIESNQFVMRLHFMFLFLFLFCHGAMNKKELVPWCRRGLLAYVYNGVSLTRMP